MPEPDDKQVETTALRLDLLKTALAGTAIAAVIGAGIITEGQLNPDNELRGRWFTDSEYRQYKSELVSKVRSHRTDPLTADERDDWIAMLNRECANVTLIDVTDPVESLNDKLEQGC